MVLDRLHDSHSDSWLDHAYKDGIALIGDAAATSDPTWGQGLSLTLRDASVLRNALLTGARLGCRGSRYAAEHHAYCEKVRTAVSWFTPVFLQPGSEARHSKQRT